MFYLGSCWGWHIGTYYECCRRPRRCMRPDTNNSKVFNSSLCSFLCRPSNRSRYSINLISLFVLFCFVLFCLFFILSFFFFCLSSLLAGAAEVCLLIFVFAAYLSRCIVSFVYLFGLCVCFVCLSLFMYIVFFVYLFGLLIYFVYCLLDLFVLSVSLFVNLYYVFVLFCVLQLC